MDSGYVCYKDGEYLKYGVTLHNLKIKIFFKKRAQGNFKDVISMCPSKSHVKSKNSEQLNHIYLRLI